jgi:hypothetical protein
MTEAEEFLNMGDAESLKSLVESKTPQLSEVLRGDAGEAFLKFIREGMFWDRETATIVNRHEISLLKKLAYLLIVNKLADEKMRELTERAKKVGSWTREEKVIVMETDPYPEMYDEIIGKGLNLNVSRDGKGREQAVRLMTGGSVTERKGFLGWRSRKKY